MSTYSQNPKTVASRTRGQHWDRNQKNLYNKQANDRTALSKRMPKLNEAPIYKDASTTRWKELEKELRKEVYDDRRAKDLGFALSEMLKD